MVGILDLPNSASKRIECRSGRCWAVSRSRRRERRRWAACGRATSAATSTRPTWARAPPFYLPVFHPGALFYFGDGHALQGDGEIVGSGLESTMDVTFQFDSSRASASAGRASRTTNTSWWPAASGRSVDAMRIAYVELIEWLVADYGFDKMDAFQIASQAGVVRVANIVDPNYTVVAKFPKRHLPAPR